MPSLPKRRSRYDLATVLEDFKQILTPSQLSQLASFSSNPPMAGDAARLTNEITIQNAGRKSRIIASRMHGFLSYIEQYYPIINTCAGSNQVAALIWGSVKLILLVGATHCSVLPTYSLFRSVQIFRIILRSCQSGLLGSAHNAPDYLNIVTYSQIRQGYNNRYQNFLL